MKLFIKNMVCNRCKLVVTETLNKLGVHPLSLELGEITIQEDLGNTEKENLNNALKPLGFEIIDDRKSRTIEHIKKLIIDLVQNHNSFLNTNLSDYLSGQLHHEYSYLTSLFTETEGTTIEQFYISQKIEKVKELLVYDELTLSEIANQLNYSSVAHLSTQFKKVTGLTPSHFKKLKEKKRKSLDEI